MAVIRVDQKLSVSPQPAPSTFEALTAEGFTAIVNDQGRHARPESRRPRPSRRDHGLPRDGALRLCRDRQALRDKSLPLHMAYPGSQPDAAARYLGDHPGDVKVITLDIGINDPARQEKAIT